MMPQGAAFAPADSAAAATKETSMTRVFSHIGLKVGAAILVLGMAGAYASAQSTTTDPPRRGGRGPGQFGPGALGLFGPLPMMAQQLGLTDTQKDQIKSLAQSHADEWKALLDREVAARNAEQAAITATQFDEVTIRQKSAELAAVQADIAVARARARGELLQILTTDQQNTLKQLESHAGQGGGRGGRGPGRGRA
jgi:Spy/CpxP family protein refolding chaperone